MHSSHAKRRSSPMLILVLVCAIFAVAAAALMARDVPAPQQPVVKTLDAGAFIKDRQ